MPNFTDFGEPSEEELAEATAEDIKTSKKPEGITLTIPAYVLDHMQESIAAALEARVVQKAERAIEKKLAEIVEEAVRKVIGDKAEELVIAAIEKPRHKFDEWGTPRGPVVTFAEQIPGAVDAYLNATVDDKGNRSTPYSGDPKRTRAAWIIGNHVRKDIDQVINSAVSGVTQQAKAIVTQKVAAFMAEQLVPAIEIKPKS